MRRHRALRTALVPSQGRLMQRVSDSVELTLEQRDCTSRASRAQGGRQERVLGTVVTDSLKRPFALSRMPQMRAHLIRLDVHEHVLFLAVGHSIWDAASTNVCLRELAAVYSALVTGATLPETNAVSATEDHSGVTKAEHYWRTQIGAPFPELPLSLAWERRSKPATSMDVQYTPVVPSTMMTALGEISPSPGPGTAAAALLAAFAALLATRTSRQALIVGVVRGNRNEANAHVIGCMAGIVPMKVDVLPDVSFSQLVGAVRGALRLATECGVEMAPFPSPASGEPIAERPMCDACFNFLPQSYLPSRESVRAGPVTVHPFISGPVWHVFHVWQFAYLDCTVLPCADGAGVYGRLGYDPERLGPTEVTRLGRQFITLVDRVVRAPDAPVGKLSAGL
jgi:hypothetical protein